MAAAAMMCMLTCPGQAAEHVWTGSADNLMHKGGNWDSGFSDWKTIWWDNPNSASITANTAVFANGQTTANRTVVIDFNHVGLGGIRVEAWATGYSMIPNATGRQFSFISPDGSLPFLIDIAEDFALGYGSDDGAAKRYMAESFNVCSAGEIRVAEGRRFDLFAKRISDGRNHVTGTGDLVKTGAGTLALHALDTAGGYSSRLLVREGAVEIASAANLGMNLASLVFDTDLSLPDGAESIGTLLIAPGAQVEFKGNAEDTGRLVMEQGGNKAGRIRLGEGATLIFSDNTFPDANYGGGGGVVHVGAGNMLVLESDGSAGRFVFRDNTDETMYLLDGAAIYNAGTLTAEYLDMTGNKAASGAAVFNAGTITLSDAVFDANESGMGGVLYNSGEASLSRGVFRRNTSDDGGAIYNAGRLVVADTSFEGNRSNGYGGAISNAWGAWLELRVSEGGVMVFSGNTDQNGRNSVDLYDSTLDVHVARGAVLDMLDPMSGISETGALAVTLRGEGTWKLAGKTNIQSDVSASFAVEEGTLYLYRGDETGSGSSSTAGAGRIVMEGADTSFTLHSGAALALGGGNLLQSGAVVFEAGSALSFHLQEGGTDALLELCAGQLAVGNGVQIHADAWIAGSHTLIDLTGEGTLSAGSAGQFVFHLGGSAFVNNERRQARFYMEEHRLVLSLSQTAHIALAWTGQGGSRWDESAASWTNGASGPAEVTGFLNGDRVTFDARSSGEVTVDAAGVSVAGMRVEGPASYTFTGGKTSVNSAVDDGHGVVATGTATAVYRNALDVAVTGARADALRAENGALVELDGPLRLSSSLGNAVMVVSGATLRGRAQAVIEGRIDVDAASILALSLTSGSRFDGALVAAAGADATLTLEAGAVWNVAGDSFLSRLDAQGATLAFTIDGADACAAIAAASLSLDDTALLIALNGYEAALSDEFLLFDLSLTGGAAELDVRFDFSRALLGEGLEWKTDRFSSTGAVYVGLAGAAIPEPASATLGVVALGMLSWRRRPKVFS